MIYLKNNAEKQRVFIPKNGEYQGKKSYRDGYEEGVEVGKAEQKSLLEPITITENGTYENENGYSVVEVNVEGGDCPDCPDCPELEEITIVENGTYEGAYDKVVVDVPQEGGDINPDTLREITITENGVYTSKYSSPTKTGEFEDGTPFYGYGELNGIVFDTQINLNDVGVLESLEFWYKGDGQDVGDAWNIILASNSEDSVNEGCVEFRYAWGNENYVRIGGNEINFQLEEGVWHHFKLNKTSDDICTLFVDDVDRGIFPLPTATSTNFYINGSVYNTNGGGDGRNANGCFGMININGYIIIPTENGFINHNTQEPLPIIQEGSYNYGINEVVKEGEPYKTIKVNIADTNGSYDDGWGQGYGDGYGHGYELGYQEGQANCEGGGETSCTLEPLIVTENGFYAPKAEEFGYLMVTENSAFDTGVKLVEDSIIELYFNTGDSWNNIPTLIGCEDTDWSENTFAVRWYNDALSVKIGNCNFDIPLGAEESDTNFHKLKFGRYEGVWFDDEYKGSMDYDTWEITQNTIYIGAIHNTTNGDANGVFRPWNGYLGNVKIYGEKNDEVREFTFTCGDFGKWGEYETDGEILPNLMGDGGATYACCKQYGDKSFDGYSSVEVRVKYGPIYNFTETTLKPIKALYDSANSDNELWINEMIEYNNMHPDLTSNGMMYLIPDGTNPLHNIYGYYDKSGIFGYEGTETIKPFGKTLVAPWVYNENNSPSTTIILPDYWIGGFDCTEVEYIDRVFEGATSLRAFTTLKNLGKSFTSVNTLDLSPLTCLNQGYYDGDCFEMIANSVYDFNVMNDNGITYSIVILPPTAKQTAVDAWNNKGWRVERSSIVPL